MGSGDPVGSRTPAFRKAGAGFEYIFGVGTVATVGGGAADEEMDAQPPFLNPPPPLPDAVELLSVAFSSLAPPTGLNAPLPQPPPLALALALFSSPTFAQPPFFFSFTPSSSSFPFPVPSSPSLTATPSTSSFNPAPVPLTPAKPILFLNSFSSLFLSFSLLLSISPEFCAASRV